MLGITKLVIHFFYRVSSAFSCLWSLSRVSFAFSLHALVGVLSHGRIFVILSVFHAMEVYHVSVTHWIRLISRYWAVGIQYVASSRFLTNERWCCELFHKFAYFSALAWRLRGIVQRRGQLCWLRVEKWIKGVRGVRVTRLDHVHFTSNASPTHFWWKFHAHATLFFCKWSITMLNKSWLLLQNSNCKWETALWVLVIIIIMYFSVTLRHARRAGALLPLFFQKGGNGYGANFSSQYHREFHS